ncbi:MAG: DNA-processing protein DprA [Bacillota bacterium]
MLYNTKDYFKLSLINASYNQNSRYKNPKLKLHLLTSVFKESITQHINLFKCSQIQLKQLIKDSFTNNRYYESRVKNVKKVLLDQEFLNKINQKSEKEIEICQNKNINYLVYEHESFPEPLKKIKLSPLMLFYKGKLPTDEELKKSLAVIGSRKHDPIGAEIASKIGALLSNNGFWNISGLALGCDTYGHKGSLSAKGKTGAILANGLAASVYPKENKSLADKILANQGFLLSELPPSTTPAPHLFKWRDRLQSGLTQGVFAVQTSQKSGTLKTINYALQQEKKVFVWNPQNLNDLTPEKIAGNLMLIGRKAPSNNFKIKAKYKLEKIIPITKPQNLLQHLEKNDFKQQSLF